MSQQQPADERELLRLQIQAYEFYAGLIDRAVSNGGHETILPKWDDQRALEYKRLAEQLRQRLEQLDREQPVAPPVDPDVSTAPEQASTH